MKFGKSLSNQIEETLPEWRDKFLSYKELKKKLKLIEPKSGERPSKRIKLDENSDDVFGAGDKIGDVMSIEEADFIRLLENELEKFNSFFVEKEEEYIIRLKDLQDSVAKAEDYSEELIKIRKEIVDLHGEMVLLENYSALNYTGLVKILKKYDKRTGALIRLPFIQRVLRQPFYTTDLLYKLVKECEVMLDHLFPKNEKPTSTEAENKDDGCDPSPPTTSRSEVVLGMPKESRSEVVLGMPKESRSEVVLGMPKESRSEVVLGMPKESRSEVVLGMPKESRSEVVLGMPKELEEIKYMESLYMKSSISALRVLKEIRSGSSTVSVFSLPPLHISGLGGTWKTIPVLQQTAK